MISLSALDTLQALDEGSVFNATHRYARELIELGLALDDAGRLRITELGRLTVRHASRSYATSDDHVANLDRFATPVDSHPDVRKPGRGLTSEEDDLMRAALRHATKPAPKDHAADWPPIDRTPNKWWKNHTELEPGPHMMKDFPIIPNPEPALPPAPDLRAVAQRMWDGDYATVEDLVQAMGSAPLAWDRARVIRAAGIANGKADIWVNPSWVAAFMDAYEGT